nr:MAG TPA: hypothetical protein [Caudoviricetes sp.]
MNKFRLNESNHIKNITIKRLGEYELDTRRAISSSYDNDSPPYIIGASRSGISPRTNAYPYFI